MWKPDFQLKRHSSPINAIDVSPDMSLIATGSSDHSIGFTDLHTRQTKYVQEHQSSVYCVSFSPLSKHLLSGSGDGTAILWDSKTGEKLGQFKGHSHIVRSSCWSPDGKFVITASNDQTACLWSLNRFTRRMVFSGLRGWARDVKWSGHTVAVAGNDTRILLFDDRTGKIIHEIETGTKGDQTSLSFHETGQVLASGSVDQYLRVWDLRNMTLLQKHAAHLAPITQVQFNPYSDDILTASKDGSVKLWNLQSSSIIATYNQHEGGCLGCAWLPSARGFVTCGEDRRICGYRMEAKALDPSTFELDGGNILQALDKMQAELNAVTMTMRSLDRRLLLQEEKLQWLSDIDGPISSRAPKGSNK